MFAFNVDLTVSSIELVFVFVPPPTNRTCVGAYVSLSVKTIFHKPFQGISPNLQLRCTDETQTNWIDFEIKMSKVMVITKQNSRGIRRIVSWRGFSKAWRAMLWSPKGRKWGWSIWEGQAALSPPARVWEHCKLPQRGPGRPPNGFPIFEVHWMGSPAAF